MAEKHIHEVDIKFPDYVRHNVNGWLDKIHAVVETAGNSLMKAAAIKAAATLCGDSSLRGDFAERYAEVRNAANMKPGE